MLAKSYRSRLRYNFFFDENAAWRSAKAYLNKNGLSTFAAISLDKVAL